MGVGLERKLDTVWRLWRNNCQLAILAHRNIGLLNESEQVGIELSALAWSSTSTLVRLILIAVFSHVIGGGLRAFYEKSSLKTDEASPSGSPDLAALLSDARSSAATA
jgi:hypothetical protein